MILILSNMVDKLTEKGDARTADAIQNLSIVGKIL